MTEQQQEPQFQKESKEPVVFSILRNSNCSECADLDHLTYLARGDAALTRRVRKHSGLSVAVVRFSRSRPL